MNLGEARELFELKEGYTAIDVDCAYKRLALQYHPDKNENSPASNIFMRQINEAYDLLKSERASEHQARDDMRSQQSQSREEAPKQEQETSKNSQAEEAYASACEFANSASTAEELEEAAQRFSSLHGYRDSAAKSAELKEKAARKRNVENWIRRRERDLILDRFAGLIFLASSIASVISFFCIFDSQVVRAGASVCFVLSAIAGFWYTFDKAGAPISLYCIVFSVIEVLFCLWAWRAFESDCLHAGAGLEFNYGRMLYIIPLPVFFALSQLLESLSCYQEASTKKKKRLKIGLSVLGVFSFFTGLILACDIGFEWALSQDFYVTDYMVTSIFSAIL